MLERLVERQSAKPLLNFLDILTVDNINLSSGSIEILIFMA